MSVLIRNMEMPKHCWQCPFHDDVDDCILLNQSCMTVWGESKRLNDCPLVEMKPHTGTWIRTVEELGESWMCSECLEEFIPTDSMDEFINCVHFCPNCGARMDGE